MRCVGRPAPSSLSCSVLRSMQFAHCAMGARMWWIAHSSSSRPPFDTGAVDLLVATYRACPELLVILLRASEGRRFRELVERTWDHDLASAAGHPIADRRRQAPTPHTAGDGRLRATANGDNKSRDRDACCTSRSRRSRRTLIASTTNSACGRVVRSRFRPLLSVQIRRRQRRRRAQTLSRNPRRGQTRQSQHGVASL